MKEKKKKFCSKLLVMSLCALIVTLISVMLSAHSAQAQGYPTRPVEIVVPLGPGTSPDILCRLIAAIGPKYLGQPMFVANKLGAAGSIAPADVVASKPDGYKLLVQNHPYFASTIYTQNPPPNLLKP